ncbi:MAG: MarR family transcriptional regulator [Planctomycetota bacterium]|nr:MarR family transcriptional regulator [Planctomycetota bacterium]
MSDEHPNLSDLSEENKILRQAMIEAKRHLNDAAARLRNVLSDEVIIDATPLEAGVAMQLAEEGVAAALNSLELTFVKRSANASPIPGDPTRRQGQFLAYIREYMMRNRHGAAPTHSELQRFFHLTPPTINSMLKRLDERGFIRRIPGKARAIELTIAPELIPPLEQLFT